MDREVERITFKNDSLHIDYTDQGSKLFYCTFEGTLLFKNLEQINMQSQRGFKLSFMVRDAENGYRDARIAATKILIGHYL